MIADVFPALQKSLKHRIWIFSDLQQALPERARYCMAAAVEDFKTLCLPCEFIWYLGDAVEGIEESHLNEAVRIQLDLLRPLQIPLRYVLGNHDFDYLRSRNRVASHFHNAVQHVPGWQSVDSLQSFYFIEELGDYTLLFLSDHTHLGGEWFTTHGIIHGDSDEYPYDQAVYLNLKNLLETSNKPIITLSHYAFSGGNRPSPLWNQLLPLPDQVKIHFYGHSHIGDKVWGKEHVYRKISYVDYQNIPQINVSSLENDRGDEIRSVFLEIYEDNSLGIFFRDHEKKQWAGMFMMPV